jgi:hypothetical protein
VFLKVGSQSGPEVGILGVFWVVVIVGVRWAPNRHFGGALIGLAVSTRSTQLPEVPAVPAVFFAYGCLVSLVSCQLDFLTFTLAIPTRVEPFSFVLGVLLIRANHQVVGVYAGSVVAQVSDYFPFSHQFSV